MNFTQNSYFYYIKIGEFSSKKTKVIAKINLIIGDTGSDTSTTSTSLQSAAYEGSWTFTFTITYVNLNAKIKRHNAEDSITQMYSGSMHF